MKTMSDLIADTRRLMYGSMADQLNFLAQEALEGDGELKMMMDTSNITPGMVLSADLNVYYVIAVDNGTKVVTVHAAYQNSYNAALAVGTPIMIRPRVTDFVLFSYLNDVIKQMSSSVNGLYREASWDDVGVWDNVYKIPDEASDMLGLTSVQFKAYGYEDLWYEVPASAIDWQPENGVIRLKVDGTGQSIRFGYKAPFLPADLITTDIEEACGLPESMHDIPPLGAAARLLRTTESRRSQTHSQSDPRRADEVQPGSNTMAAREMMREFEDRMDQERIRLVNRNPYKVALPR